MNMEVLCQRLKKYFNGTSPDLTTSDSYVYDNVRNISEPQSYLYERFDNISFLRYNGITYNNFSLDISAKDRINATSNTSYNTMATDQTSWIHVSMEIRYYIATILLPCLCIFGVAGNVLNIIIVSKQHIKAPMDRSAYVILIILAVSGESMVLACHILC